MRDVYVGTFTGAAADIDVECGFVPSAVIFFEGDTPSFAIAVVDGAHVEHAASVTAVGTDVTALDTEADGEGFTVANGSAFNVNAVDTNFIAFRGES